MVVEEGDENRYLIENNLLLPCTEATFNFKITSLEEVQDIVKTKVSKTEAQRLYGDNQ